MCGIAGAFRYLDSGALPDRSAVERMSAALQSRGPDGSGRWVSADGAAVLDHRRLAIIDLTDGGAQPMRDPLTGNVIVFNGEIYNYRELRGALVARGCAFRTASDTEVLLHLYREHGRDMLPMLRGMFAFAIFNPARNELLLVRDTYGIKPLYYGVSGGVVWFASQVKALAASRMLAMRPSAAGHVGFFLLGHVPEPFTLYESIRAVAPGSCLTFSGGHVNSFVFDSLVQRIGNSHAPRTGTVARIDVGAAIRDSVAHHLIADVPVAVFLSSGLDSSALAAIAARTGAPELAAITLGFREYAGLPQDEVPLARRFSTSLGLAHHVDVIGEQDFLDSLDHLFASMDQPSIDGVNTYFVSRTARRAGFKVALSGLGGDELLGGYSTFASVPRLVGNVARVPAHRLLGRLARRLLAPVAHGLGRPKAAGILEYGGDPASAYLLLRALRMPWELDEMLQPETISAGLQELDVLRHMRESVPGELSWPQRMLLLESQWYMRNQLLRDSDWASMAHSLELRVPLVDVTLLDAVLAARAAGQVVGKTALHEAVPEGLPAWLNERPKTGFSIPVAQWCARLLPEGSKPGHGLRDWARFVHNRAGPATRRPVRCVFWLEFLSPHLAALLRALVMQGTEVTVVVLGKVSEHRLRLGWPATEHGTDMDGIKVLSPQAADALLRDNGGELIHITEGLGGNAVVRPWVERVRGSGCRWGVMAEAVDRRGVRGALRRLLYVWRFRLAGRRPDFVLAIGAQAVAWMRSTSGLGRRVYPFAYFLPATGDPATGHRDARDTPRILYVGQLIRRKRVDLLMRAYARFCRSRARLHIVGAGPEAPALRRLAQSLRIADDVTFHGAVSMAQARTFLAGADCLVLPSDHDGWGAVACEALLSGVPAIVSSAVGACQVVQCSGTGGVFRAGRTSALGKLLDQQLDSGCMTAPQRQRLADWARSCLSGDAGAAHLQRVLGAYLDDQDDPPAPWAAQPLVGISRTGLPR